MRRPGRSTGDCLNVQRETPASPVRSWHLGAKRTGLPVGTALLPATTASHVHRDTEVFP